MSMTDSKRMIAASLAWESATASEVATKLNFGTYGTELMIHSLCKEELLKELKSKFKVTAKGLKWLEKAGYEVPSKPYKTEFRKYFPETPTTFKDAENSPHSVLLGPEKEMIHDWIIDWFNK